MCGLIDALTEHLRSGLGHDYIVHCHMDRHLTVYNGKMMTSMQIIIEDGTASYFAACTGQMTSLQLADPEFLDQLIAATVEWHKDQAAEIEQENEKERHHPTDRDR